MNMRRSGHRTVRFGPALTLALALAFAWAGHVSAETLVGSNIDTRTVVLLKAPEAEAQKWLTAPWQVSGIPGGPGKGANLALVFIDRLLNEDAAGKPARGGTDRMLVVVLWARHPQTGDSGLNVVRIYTANPESVPGPYRNSVQASLRFEQTLTATGIEPATISERWDVRDTAGGGVELQAQYLRTVPSRARRDQRLYGGPDPSFMRIYRLDEGVNLLKSVPAGVDRLQRHRLGVTMAELRGLFDGSEQLIAVTALPWYARQTLLP